MRPRRSAISKEHLFIELHRRDNLDNLLARPHWGGGGGGGGGGVIFEIVSVTFLFLFFIGVSAAVNENHPGR